MSLYNDILSGKAKIALIGLGYVGMPIAVAFAKKASVIGFDISKAKVELYMQGIDPTKEVGDDVIKSRITSYNVCYTKLLRFYIVKVFHCPAVCVRP